MLREDIDIDGVSFTVLFIILVGKNIHIILTEFEKASGISHYDITHGLQIGLGIPAIPLNNK